MGFFDEIVPNGGVSPPVMQALSALLSGHVAGQPTNPRQTAVPPADAPADEPDSQPVSQHGADSPQPGFAGGLQGLLSQFEQAGHGDAARSWVGDGPNQPVQPEQVGGALGQTVVSALAQRTGISEQTLLTELSRVLPVVVDRLTPGGQMPGQGGLASILGRL